MPLPYFVRLRRHFRDLQERDPTELEEPERIAAQTPAPRSFKHLQAVLALCILLLVAPSIFAFVAANWSAMTPASRLVALFLLNAAAVFGTYLLARRNARDRTISTSRLVDGLATLSLIIAALTLAQVAQTFHVAEDFRDFAGTVAALGLMTAFVARSTGAAIVACVALIAVDSGLGELDLASPLRDPASGAGVWFWAVAPALFLAGLSGWLPARASTLFLILAAFIYHLGGVPADLAFFLPPDRILAVAALALALGHALSGREPRGDRVTRFHEGAHALKRAAVGLCLLGIVMVAARSLGYHDDVQPTITAALALVAIAVAALVVALSRSPARATTATSDLLVLAAAASTLLVWLVAGASREASTFWTVWGGIVPALMLVVAGDLGHRRVLYGCGMALTVGITLGMLAASRNLIAFSGNLLLCAALLGLALMACRWAARRVARRAA